MNGRRFSRVLRRVEATGISAFRRAGRWAGRTLPAWGQRIEEISARLADESPSTSAASSTSAPPEASPPTFGMPGAPGVGTLPDLEIPPDQALTEQLEHFVESLRGATGSYAVFVADSQGLPLVSRHGTEDQIAITAALDRALGPIRESLRGAPQGSVSVEVDRDNVLQVIWVNTEIGRYVVGMVLPQSLGGDVVESIRRQLVPLFVKTRGNAA